MPRAKLIKPRVRTQLKPRLTVGIDYYDMPGYMPIVFKFERGDRVAVLLDGKYRRTGTITSRVPCEPEPLYYIGLPNERIELVPQSAIEGVV